MGDSAGKLGGEIVRVLDNFAIMRTQEFMSKVMDVLGRYALGNERI